MSQVEYICVEVDYDPNLVMDNIFNYSSYRDMQMKDIDVFMILNDLFLYIAEQYKNKRREFVPFLAWVQIDDDHFTFRFTTKETLYYFCEMTNIV